ncbi:serine hydrolase FSH [Chaetomium fimeti]|uniref:Serine hydrolase FSH n=1 Tax=Chaetomium fimeti TaxID=1854472 RepID=A0AAE0LNR9_9PEZI|nr:serine hydrolase FSH [Chaetomium fimeti]
MEAKRKWYPPQRDRRPRILCLHGGGTTAAIFRAQCRVLIRHLPHFRLVFADAPFVSEPGPDVVPVYEAWGPPFRRWLRWKHSHPALDDEAAARAILTSLELCKARDDLACGGRGGPWVGVLGFSQGAKIAASLLFDQHVWESDEDDAAAKGYRFGVLMAGRGPLVALRRESLGDPALMPAAAMSMQCFEASRTLMHRLRLPTIHVHGLRDEGLTWHRKMSQQYCDPDVTTIVEWQGAHRVPVKADVVEPIAAEIYRVAKECGVFI